MPNDNKTFLEKYSEYLTTGASSIFDKLQDSAPKRETNKSDELPDFMKTPTSDNVPSARDILGLSSESKATSESNPPKKVDTPTDASTTADEKIKDELPPETMEDVMKDLDALIGMDEIKENVRTLVNLLKIQDERKAHELPVVEIGLHSAFLGNPGTGKTTVARIMGRIYKASGRLSKGHLVEVDRQGLVGGFVGQTAIKTQEKLDESAGGVLFIDEAYSLVPESGENDFGQEAITTILKYMEDNRDDFVLIAAGYPNEMERFLDSNPGFVSRFNDTIFFPDYTDEELYSIFELNLKKNDYTVSKQVAAKISEDFTWFITHKNKNFANGRLARKYFENIVENQANRLSKNKKTNSKAQLKRITASDLPKVLEKLI